LLELAASTNAWKKSETVQTRLRHNGAKLSLDGIKTAEILWKLQFTDLNFFDSNGRCMPLAFASVPIRRIKRILMLEKSSGTR
jgi:hypothetical protein